MPVPIEQLSSFVMVLDGYPFGAFMFALILALLAILLWLAKRAERTNDSTARRTRRERGRTRLD